MKRIVIVGSSCAGKTTLGRELAALFDSKRIELDEYHWLPDWQERDTEEFKKLVAQAIESDKWVVDGNYRKLGSFVWDAADTIIWLNLPFWRVYLRLLRRAIYRLTSREALWNGNRETLYLMLFDRDSLLYWIPRTWRKRNQRLRKIFDHGIPDKILLEFRSPAELATWKRAVNP